MVKLRNEKLKENSRKLRKDMTEEERKLWHCFLKTCEIKFYRQRVFENYIADFYCPSAHLIIEVDGSQHFEDEGAAKDEKAQRIFLQLGHNRIAFQQFTNQKRISNGKRNHLQLYR